MPTLPEKVKIGAYTITVRYVPNLMIDANACGQYCPRTKEIQIDPDLCPEQQFGTFCHEVIEAWAEINEIKPLNENHDAIVTLGECLHQYVRDNGKEILPQ